MPLRRGNGWKVDRELANRRERERNAGLTPEFDPVAADRRLREGMERLRRSLDRSKAEDPPF